jgi:hypothetical protein
MKKNSSKISRLKAGVRWLTNVSSDVDGSGIMDILERGLLVGQSEALADLGGKGSSIFPWNME